MKYAISILLAFGLLSSQAATYYVSTTNSVASNTNSGSESLPWKTVDYAASTAIAGDTVYVKPGTYNEFVTMDNSGTNGGPITFIGERGGSGEWITIIDPSISASNNWGEDLSVGVGVYTNLTIPWEVSEMTIGDQRVGFAFTNGLMLTPSGAAMIDSSYTGSGLTTGLELLAMASAQSYSLPINGTTGEVWDGIEALYCSNATNTWLRLRDGSDPNGLPIRVNRNSTGSESNDPNYPAVRIQSKSYITFRNFKVRGAFVALLLNIGGNHIVESNYLAGGYARLFITTCTNNTIRGNYITTDWYATNSPGAWGGADSDMTDARVNHYVVGKFLMGASSQWDFGIYLVASRTNAIYHNQITNILCDGIALGELSYSSSIYSNVIANCSAHGIMFYSGQEDTRVYDNAIYDNNVNWRFHGMGESPYTRSVYIYRNQLWLPHGAGDQIYVHASSEGNATNKLFWVYQNTIAGGRDMLNVTDAIDDIGGLTGVSFLNNLISDSTYYYIGVGGTAWVTNSWMLGAFDYNLVTPVLPAWPAGAYPAWLGTHNITNDTPLFVTNAIPSYALTNGSIAIDAGVDIPTVYPTLPQTAAVKVGASWDIGALEYGTPPEDPPEDPPASVTNTVRISGPVTISGPSTFQ